MKPPRHAATNYKMLAPYICAADHNDGYARFESSGFEPLVVEKLYYTDYRGNPVYSVAHYYTQNGDAMRDPEITFSVDHIAETVIPQTYQLDSLGIYREIFIRENGKTLYSRRLLIDTDEGLWEWLQNLPKQGFTPDPVPRN